MTDSTSPAGGFRVDAPQPEKSRQEEAPLDLDALDALDAAATPGPWSAADEHGLMPGATPAWCVSRMGDEMANRGRVWLYDVAYVPQRGDHEQADAEFIAAAREAVPALVGEVRRLGEALQQAQRENELLREQRDGTLNAWWHPEDSEPPTHCGRCGVELALAGSHYHCAGCDSIEATSMLGHFIGVHWVKGRAVKTAMHHHTSDSCELALAPLPAEDVPHEH